MQITSLLVMHMHREVVHTWQLLRNRPVETDWERLTGLILILLRRVVVSQDAVA
jgi:hypothetical protein